MSSDLLTARGWEVTHLLGRGKSEAHRLWDVAASSATSSCTTPTRYRWDQSEDVGRPMTT